MRIVLFGATGNIGRRILAEALRRGHEVVGVVRDPNAVKSPDVRVTLMAGDATDPVSVTIVARGADAVVCAISPRANARGRPAPRLADAASALIEGLKTASVPRVVFVGGAGTLEVAPGRMLMDEPGFPAAYMAEAVEGRDALAVWRRDGDGLEWTFLSPAAEIGAGERTGRYRTTDETLLTDASGRSFITYEDYAVAVLDELERPRHVRRRMGVAY